MIELEDVRFRYRESGPSVLADVSFTVRDGERWLVVGPSGSGKSTLLRLFNGLVPHFHGGVLAGRVRVAGRDPLAAGPAAMSDAVGFVFQNPEAQFVAERVEDEVAFALENHGVPPDEMSRRIGRALERLGMQALRRRRLSTLSGGERQRVALAGALVLRPRLLVLDEPTSQLDPRAAEELLHLLDRLHRETGLTVVLSEHRVERVAQWADRVCRFLEVGEPPRIGAPRDVLAGTALASPVTRLGSRLGWRPLPLTVDEAKTFLPTHRAEPTSTNGEETVEAAAFAGREGTPELLRARELSFRYPGAEADAVENLDFSLRPGERTALMGPNGSGKSTLLKLLVGLLSPASGTVEIRGRDTAELDLLDRTGSVGFVPQHPSRLLFNETVAEEIRYTRRSHGLPPAPAEHGVPRPLARLGLARPLTTLGAAVYPPRGAALARLCAALRRDDKTAARTLAGCRIIPRGRQLLVWKPSFAAPTAGVDGLVVPTARPVSWMREAMALASSLDCVVVAVCSRRNSATDAVHLAQDLRVATIALDIEDCQDVLAHSSARALLKDTQFEHKTDAGDKRNLALLLSRIAGWERVLFLDDDIYGVDPRHARAAAGLLDRYAAVGLRNVGFPDNSVVCHAFRMIGGPQEILTPDCPLADVGCSLGDPVASGPATARRATSRYCWWAPSL